MSNIVIGRPGVWMSGSGSTEYVLLPTYLRDLFATDDAAPLTTPRTAEPGPGIQVADGDTNVFGVSGGRLVVSGTPASLALLTMAFERAAGRCYRVDVPVVTTAASGRPRVGWSPDATTALMDAGASYSSTTAVLVTEGGTSLATVTLGAAPHRYLHVLRAQGSLLLARQYSDGDDEIAGTYQLLWPGKNYADGTMYKKIAINTGGASVLEIDNEYVVDLGGVYGQAFGLATAWVFAPSSGEVVTGNAEGFVEVLWTPAASSVLSLRFRRTDDNNCLLLRCDQAAGTIKLYDVQAGVETEYDSGKTQTFVDGATYRIMVRHIGTSVRSYVGIVSKHNTTISVQQAVAGANITYGGAVADLATWPSTVVVL